MGNSPWVFALESGVQCWNPAPLRYEGTVRVKSFACTPQKSIKLQFINTHIESDMVVSCYFCIFLLYTIHFPFPFLDIVENVKQIIHANCNLSLLGWCGGRCFAIRYRNPAVFCRTVYKAEQNRDRAMTKTKIVSHSLFCNPLDELQNQNGNCSIPEQHRNPVPPVGTKYYRPWRQFSFYSACKSENSSKIWFKSCSYR